MTTKLKIASEILRILANGDRLYEYKVDEREIAIQIDQWRSKLIEEEYLQNEAIGRKMIPSEYIVSYTNFALLDDNGLKYIILPARPIKLPEDKGILTVTTRQEPSNFFVPIYNGHFGLGAGLEAGNMENKCGYYPEGKRLYFTGNTNKLYIDDFPTNLPKDIVVKLIPDSQDIGIGAELPISAGMEAEIVTRIVQARAPYLSIPQDKTIDQVS